MPRIEIHTADEATGEATMEIKDNGSNPLIILSAKEVYAWLREKADEAGYQDRETCAVQLTTKLPMAGGSTFHHECPELVIMVSNIPNPATAAETVCHDEQLRIWAHDHIVGTLLHGDWLREDMSHDDCIALERVMMRQLKRIIEAAFKII